MTTDFVLQAASDQAELSNIRNVTQAVNLTCPIYNGCNVVGTGVPAQAQASIDGGGSASGTGTTPGGTPAAPGGSFTGSSGGTGATPVKGTPSGGSDSGCATSAQGHPGSGVAFGALAGVVGLFIGRSIRMRRRRASA